ncbi:hypothetical protein GQ42DRAFT_152498 [Ramicandelaber brevisporus]|nr:hypothetical protein GQ42DRAFT_152498 [Ramicandelaber brevisporus]
MRHTALATAVAGSLLVAITTSPLSVFVAAQNDCFSIKGSKVCPQFGEVYLSSKDPISTSVVQNVGQFDTAVNAFLSTQYGSELQRDFGCSGFSISSSSPVHPQFAASYYCAVFLARENSVKCNQNNGKTVPQLCSSTCTDYYNSIDQSFIRNDTACPANVRKEQAFNNAKARCSSTPAFSGGSGSCVDGVANEASTCGFMSGDTDGVCGFCASGDAGCCKTSEVSAICKDWKGVVTQEKKKSGGLSTAAIVVIAVFGSLAVIGIIAFIIWKRRKAARNLLTSQNDAYGSAGENGNGNGGGDDYGGAQYGHYSAAAPVAAGIGAAGAGAGVLASGSRPSTSQPLMSRHSLALADSEHSSPAAHGLDDYTKSVFRRSNVPIMASQLSTPTSAHFGAPATAALAGTAPITNSSANASATALQHLPQPQGQYSVPQSTPSPVQHPVTAVSASIPEHTQPQSQQQQQQQQSPADHNASADGFIVAAGADAAAAAPSVPPATVITSPPTSDYDGAIRCTVLYQYEPSIEDELPITPGDVVIVFQSFDDGWGQVRKESTGEMGMIPLACTNFHEIQQQLNPSYVEQQSQQFVGSESAYSEPSSGFLPRRASSRRG